MIVSIIKIVDAAAAHVLLPSIFTRDLATATCYQAFANLAMGKTTPNNDRSSLKDLKQRQKEGRKRWSTILLQLES